MKRYNATTDRISALLLSGVWTERAMRHRLRKYLGNVALKSQRNLVRDLTSAYEVQHLPSPDQLYAFLRGRPAFVLVLKAVMRRELRLLPVLASPVFAPSQPFAGLDIPRIATAGDLAQWLGVSIAHLDWLADSKRQHASAETTALQHYAYIVIAKSSGRPRLLEAPKYRTKEIQRRILREILDRVAVHRHAHGFVKGRSCLSSASVHVAETCVLAMDIENFFPTVTERRIHGLFRNLGYPWSVARLLTGLCTTATPVSVFADTVGARGFDWDERKLLSQPHLAQGAPTSPGLANLSAWRLDQRLTGLASSYGANYTRYADDLAFSGSTDFAVRVASFRVAVEAIVRDEGFAIHAAKTRVMHSQGQQHLTGIVINSHVNVARTEYDRLKAVLHNCRVFGPADQNRDGRADFRQHLNGRVGWVENVNPARGAKLRATFEKIAW